MPSRSPRAPKRGGTMTHPSVVYEDEEEEDREEDEGSGDDEDEGDDYEGGASSSKVGRLQFKRWSSNSKILSVRVEPSKSVSNVCVLIGFKLDVNPIVLNLLKGYGTGIFEGNDVDTTVVAYAAFESIKQDLMGNPTNAALNKASAVNCGSANGEFLISVVCDRSLTSARKCGSIALKNLKFSSLGSHYRILCNMLNIKPDVSAFAHAVNVCNKGVESGVRVVMTGKLKISNQQLLDRTAEVMEGKIKDLQNKEGAHQRTIGSTTGKNEMFDIRVPNSLDAMLVRSFVEEYLSGTILSGDTLFIPLKFETQFSRLRDGSKVENFARKMMRLKDNLAGVLCYTAAMDCGVETKNIKSNIDYSQSSVKSIINSALKG